MVYGVIDNIISRPGMIEFENFLAANHIYAPSLSAVISVYVQLIVGLFYITGYRIKLAGFIAEVNFTVALIMVHRNHAIEASTPALTMLD